MSLIYLLSSLPMLTFAIPPVQSVDVEVFLEACREQLGASDAEAAEALITGIAYEHPFVDEWREKEAIMRNAVVRERARVTGLDAERWLRPTTGCDTQVESLVEDAFQESDPLSKEIALDRVRWLIADDMQGPNPLSLRAALSYAVKLSILSKWRALSSEDGRAAFDQLTRRPIILSDPNG